MSICEDLIGGLTDLAQAVAQGNSACGCGSGIGGGTDGPPSDIVPGAPGEQIGDPPPGFSTWAEYETYKCDAAYTLVDGMVSDLEWLETADLILLTALGFAASLLTPIPGDEIVFAFGLVLAILGLGQPLFGGMADAITNNLNAILCALYTAPDAPTALSNWEDALEDAIADEIADLVLRFAATQLAFAMVNYVGVNLLFERDEAYDRTLQVGDCSECECGDFVIWGTETATPNRYDAEQDGATWRVAIFVNSTAATYDEEDHCGPEMELNINYGPDGGDCHPTECFRVWDSSGSMIYGPSTSPWPDDTCGRHFQIKRDADYEVGFTREVCL